MFSQQELVGFFKLPPEIRIYIYRLILAPKRVLLNIRIADLHPDDHYADAKNRRNTRTSYKAKDHSERACARNFEPNALWRPCTFSAPKWKDAKTTYTLHKYTWEERLNLGLLQVGHQVRAEAVPIFYGENTFSFLTVSSLLPFLEDRPVDSLLCMRSLCFSFTLEVGKLQADRQQSWAHMLEDLSRFPKLRLEKLEVFISDRHLRIAQNLKLHSKYMRWVRTLSKSITNLDMLGVEINYENQDDSHSEHGRQIIRASTTSEDLWAFLAPKMLKPMKDGTHDAESLKKKKKRITHNADGWELDWAPFLGTSRGN